LVPVREEGRVRERVDEVRIVLSEQIVFSIRTNPAQLSRMNNKLIGTGSRLANIDFNGDADEAALSHSITEGA
jgi:hypothetical protein